MKKTLDNLNNASWDYNIFLLIERYLAHPTAAMAKKIKERAIALRIEITIKIEQERIGCPVKPIGADEIHPVLFDIMGKCAQEASFYSMRFMYNEGITNGHDPQYIFRVSEEEKKQLYKLIGEFLAAGDLSPDGLIFAYDRYIERYENKSKFTYVSDSEAVLYRQHFLLQFKAKELAGRGQHDAASCLLKACNDIAKHIHSYSNDPQKEHLTQITTTLLEAKKDPILRAHRGVKEIITNFLLALSVFGLFYLAATAKDRSSFWYHPNTDSENTMDQFISEMEHAARDHNTNFNRVLK